MYTSSPFIQRLTSTMFYFINFFFSTKMSFLSPPKHRNPKVLNSNSAAEGGKGRALLEFPNPRAKSKTPGGIPDATGKLASAAWLSNGRKPTKLLMNVNLQSSLGPVQVVMPQEDSVGDLIKAVVDIYTREKRRPLLTSSDHRIYELHYSQFCLEGLKPEEKLKNLGSRNFFLCQRPSHAVISISSSCSNQAKGGTPFPLTKLMDFLL
nr:uncharacterized protein LOC113702754 isoform X1 [Coffea arabica]XP_027083039.1 uncharacterized protein LOC113705392 [Coffea arabica]